MERESYPHSGRSLQTYPRGHMELPSSSSIRDSKPFDTLADLGSCVNIISLDLFKKLNIVLLEETDHIFGLADGTKSYPIGIVKDVEVHIGKLKLLNDFNVIDMKKDPEIPLLVGRGFLATTNVVIDYRMAKITMGEGITRSVFGVKRGMRKGSVRGQKGSVPGLCFEGSGSTRGSLKIPCVIGTVYTGHAYIDLQSPVNILCFRKFTAYPNPFLPMNIISRKAYNTIMINGLEGTGKNLVAVVKDVYVFVGSFTYITDYVVLEDIGEFIRSNMAEVLMGRPFRNITKLNYDVAKGLVSFTRIFDIYTYRMPRTIPRLKSFNWRKVQPLLELSQNNLMKGLRHPHEKHKFMYKNYFNLGPKYQVDESMKEWLVRGHASIHEVT
ncbi:homeodomain-like protein [Tanacetum coccineum]